MNSITSGDNGICVGYNAGKQITTSTNSVAIGSNSLGANSVGGLEEMVSDITGNSTTSYINAWQTIVPENGFENHQIKEIDIFFYNGTGTMDLTIEIYDSSPGSSANPNTRFSGLTKITSARNSNVTADTTWPPSATTFTFSSPVTATGTLYLWIKDTTSNSSNISVAKTSTGTNGGAGNNYGTLRHTVRGVGGGTTTGNNNVSIGYQSLNVITTGNDNIAIGNTAGNNISTSSNNIIIGSAATPSVATTSNEIVIGQGATGHGANKVVIGNGSCTAWHPHDDNEVDLGNSSYRFKYIHAINGTIQTSDRRQKMEIENINIGLDFVNKLRPVTYKWKTGKNNNNNKKYGLIAQEVETVLQQNGIYNKYEIIKYDSESDIYGISYTELISPLIKSVQELSNKNDKLKDDIKQLNEKMNTIIKN